MELTNPNQPVNPSENLTQPIQHPVNNQRNNLPIILGVLILLLVVGGSAYYLGMQNAKPSIQRTLQVNPTTSIPTDTQSTQILDDKEFKVIISEKEIFIDKKKLQNLNNVDIARIEDYEVSPDKTKIALLALGGISSYFLYLSDRNGENIVYIGIAKEIEWSNNGKFIAYTSPVTDIGPHRFSIYNIDSKMTKELEDKQSNNPTKYSNLLWSKDDLSITADYHSYKIPGGEEISSGKNTYSFNQFK